MTVKHVGFNTNKRVQRQRKIFDESGPLNHGPIMNFLTGLVNNIKEINSATLTGAVDIVIVEQEDGKFRSTPFHVR